MILIFFSVSEINLKIQTSKFAESEGYERALVFLEEAHIFSQPFALPHFVVHWKMLTLALKFGKWKEVIGQVP
jgi:hypothetical protein